MLNPLQQQQKGCRPANTSKQGDDDLNPNQGIPIREKECLDSSYKQAAQRN